MKPDIIYIHRDFILKRVDGEYILSVCANCFPGDSIFDKYPWLTDDYYKISHGICAKHKESMLADIRSRA